MSHSVHDRLRELEGDVRELQVLPAAAVRARGRSRGRRQIAALTAAGVVVAGTAGVALAWPRQGAAPDGGLPVGGPAISCVLALPSSPAEVRVRVLDGGAAAGLPETTATQLRAREFAVVDGAGGERAAGGAVLRYGPAAIGAANLLRAVVHGDVTMRFDPDRGDDVVDLTLGPAFRRLASTTEINQNLVVLGRPTAPPGC